MNNGILFLIIFLIIFLIYYLYLIIKQKKNTLLTVSQYNFLVNRYKLDSSNEKRLMLIVAFANSYIISNVTIILDYLKVKLIWQLLIGIAIIFCFIIITYGIIGVFINQKK